jgi:O-antigen ligase
MIVPLLIVTAQNVDQVYEGSWRRWVSRLWYAAVPLCIFAIFGTYSRGGFLALAATALAFVLLQRRRFISMAALTSAAVLVLLFAPIPESYLERLNTIRTYDEIGEDSALSRQHFWRVGLQMGLTHPLGIGLRQYEAAYDSFDTSHGRFGRRRAVHSAHVQVFAELGFGGALVWIWMFGYAIFLCLRVRRRSRDERLPPAQQHFMFTAANGLLASMTGFVVGGAFLALALNDITWLTFALVATLDRITQPIAQPVPIVSEALATPPVAFRAVRTFASASEPRA